MYAIRSYYGGHYGFIMSNWLRSLIGIVGLVFLLFISGLALVIARFDKAYPLIIGTFSRKHKPETEEDDLEMDDDQEEDASNELIAEDDIV